MTETGILSPQFVTSMVTILVMFHVLLGAAAYLILLERKVCSWVQDRIGPNRVGPLGLLQPIADGLKLFAKEEFMPRGVEKTLFILAPALTVIPALIAFAVIPWGGTLDLATVPIIGEALGFTALAADDPGRYAHVIGANINIGIIFLLATAALGVYGVSIGGWASNNKYSFLGGLRAGAQMISYEIPMGLTLLCVILMCGSIRPDEIIEAQLAGGEWFILHQPIAAIIFYICLLAEANRAPFDLAEAEAELVGGWHTEYSSMKWALFFMGEYVSITVGSAFFALLFLGGWSLNPLGVGPDLPAGGGLLIILLQFGVMLGKVFLLVFLTMMIRWTLPRFRFDQLMKIAWESIIPISLLLVLVTSFFVYMGWTPYMWAGSLGALAIIWLVSPLLPKQAEPNHRIGLIGSRFSPLNERDAVTGVTDPRASIDSPLHV